MINFNDRDDVACQFVDVDTLKVNLLKEINQKYGQISILGILHSDAEEKLINWTKLFNSKYDTELFSIPKKQETIQHLEDIKNAPLKATDLSISSPSKQLDGGPGTAGKMRMKDFIIRLAKAETLADVIRAIHASKILISSHGENELGTSQKNGPRTIYAALCESFKIKANIDDEAKSISEYIFKGFKYLANDYYSDFTKHIGPILIRELVQHNIEDNDLKIMYPPLEEAEFNTRQTLRRCLEHDGYFSNDLRYQALSDAGINVVLEAQEKSVYDLEAYKNARVAQGEFIKIPTGVVWRTQVAHLEQTIFTGMLVCLKPKQLIFKISEDIQTIYFEQNKKIQNPYANGLFENDNQDPLLCTTDTGLKRMFNFMENLKTIYLGTQEEAPRQGAEAIQEWYKTLAIQLAKLAQLTLKTFQNVNSPASKNIICKIIADNIKLPMQDKSMKSLSELAIQKLDQDNLSHAFKKRQECSHHIKDRIEVVMLALEQIAGRLTASCGKVIQSNVEEFISNEWKLPVYITPTQTQLMKEKLSEQNSYNSRNRRHSVK